MFTLPIISKILNNENAQYLNLTVQNIFTNTSQELLRVIKNKFQHKLMLLQQLFLI